MAPKAPLWKATFVFRNRSRMLFIAGDMPEKKARRHFIRIAKTRHWRLLKLSKGDY